MNPTQKYLISTPNISMKRLLKKGFKDTYQVDEFRTSKLDYRTTDENLIVTEKITNIRIKKKDGKTKSFHSVLVSKILVSAENKNGSGSSKRVFMKSYQQ